MRNTISFSSENFSSILKEIKIRFVNRMLTIYANITLFDLQNILNKNLPAIYIFP